MRKRNIPYKVTYLTRKEKVKQKTVMAYDYLDMLHGVDLILDLAEVIHIEEGTQSYEYKPMNFC